MRHPNMSALVLTEVFDLNLKNAGLVLSIVDDAISKGTPLDLPPMLTLAEDLRGWIARHEPQEGVS